MPNEFNSWSAYQGGPPMGLWDDGKATTDARGGLSVYGTSDPASGRMPFDDYKTPPLDTGWFDSEGPVGADYIPPPSA